MKLNEIHQTFTRIGIQFHIKAKDPDSQGRLWYWRRHASAPPRFRTGAGASLWLEYLDDPEGGFDLAVASPRDGAPGLLLAITWFERRSVHMITCWKGLPRVTRLDAPQDVSLERLLPRVAEQLLEFHGRDKSHAKRLRRARLLSYEDARACVPLSRAEYADYVRLAEACRTAKFLAQEGPVISAYGAHPCNTYGAALIRIAKQAAHWRAQPETWRPATHNAARAFRSLLDHLFVRFPVPVPLETVWFRPRENWVPCYLAVAKGANLRDVPGLRFPLTRRMAHECLGAPSRLTFEQALRWGQVRGLGGSEGLFHALSATRIPGPGREGMPTHEFWQTVVAWLIRNPMLSPDQYGPVVDYIREARRRDPRFRMAGRTPQALLRAMAAWHGELGQVPTATLSRTWSSHGMDWLWVQKNEEGARLTWRMEEITTAERLREEGKTMRHCIFTYLQSCTSGTTAVLSLRADDQPVLTVAVNPRLRALGEVRGVCNRCPSPAESSVVRRWAAMKLI